MNNARSLALHSNFSIVGQALLLLQCVFVPARMGGQLTVSALVLQVLGSRRLTSRAQRGLNLGLCGLGRSAQTTQLGLRRLVLGASCFAPMVQIGRCLAMCIVELIEVYDLASRGLCLHQRATLLRILHLTGVGAPHKLGLVEPIPLLLHHEHELIVGEHTCRCWSS